MLLTEKLKADNVLILMPDKHLGNFVVSLPAISALCHYYRDKNIGLVIDDAYREIAECVNGIGSLILYPRRKLAKSNPAERSFMFVKFLKKLRSFLPDIAIDLEGRHVSSTLTFLSGAPVRIGYSSAKRAFLYNYKIELTGGERHRIFRYIEIASEIIGEKKGTDYHLKSTNRFRESLRSKINDTGIKHDAPLICIHPGAGRIFREWTSEGFAEIADWLNQREYQVALIGSAADRRKIEEVKSLMKTDAYDMGGRLSLGELIALFELGSVYIGNDTGPLHLAAITGSIPIVGLYFRPGADRTWYPYTRDSMILQGDAGCVKCKGKDCEIGFRCTTNLSAFEVKARLERFLKNLQIFGE